MKELKERFIFWTKYILLLVSVVFIVMGVTKGENLVVLQKAVRICLECIGIG